MADRDPAEHLVGCVGMSAFVHRDHEAVVSGPAEEPPEQDTLVCSRNRCPAVRAQTAGSPALPADCTTVVVRNIPRTYSPDMVLVLLRQHCGEEESPIDFLYVPFDPNAPGLNLGLAIVNFRVPEALSRFAAGFHFAMACDVFPGCRSHKLCEIVPAPVQGKDGNIRKCQGCPMAAEPEWLPRVYDRAGCATILTVVKPRRLRSGSPREGSRGSSPTFVGG